MFGDRLRPFSGRTIIEGMKWLVSCLLAAALALSGYAVYKVKKIESSAKPQIRPIVSQIR